MVLCKQVFHAPGPTGLLVVVALLLNAAWAGAFSSGPLDGLTNAPGEGNCTACHGSFALNSGAGTLGISGLPQSYAPGTSYVVTISLADPQALRWGFEFTILDSEGVSVGALSPVDANTQISTGGAFNRTYAKHTTAGNQLNTPDSVTWDVNWLAPAAGAGDLTLYVAGNAANANFSTSGDYIYTTSMVSSETVASSVPGATALARLLPASPNPFNPRTELRFSLASDLAVVLSVYDVQGRRIARVFSGELSAGAHSYTWSGQDDAGRLQPSGVYFARLQDMAGRDLHRPMKMTLAK